MPQYFFETGDGAVDTTGVMLAGLAEARHAAVSLAREMLEAPDAAFWAGKTWRLYVRDEWGLSLFHLDLTAVPVAILAA